MTTCFSICLCRSERNVEYDTSATILFAYIFDLRVVFFFFTMVEGLLVAIVPGPSCYSAWSENTMNFYANKINVYTVFIVSVIEKSVDSNANPLLTLV